MPAFETNLGTISTGRLNTVNESVIANAPSIGGRSRRAGQLGCRLGFNQSSIVPVQDPNVGTLYAGIYQYVHLDPAATEPVIGGLCYWNPDEAVGDYIVTNDSAVVTDPNDGAALAGVFINVITPGNYGFIQVLGLASVLYTDPVSDAAIGNVVYAVAAGSPGATLLSDVDDGLVGFPLVVGWSASLPVAATLGLVQLSIAQRL